MLIAVATPDLGIIINEQFVKKNMSDVRKNLDKWKWREKYTKMWEGDERIFRESYIDKISHN